MRISDSTRSSIPRYRSLVFVPAFLLPLPGSDSKRLVLTIAAGILAALVTGCTASRPDPDSVANDLAAITDFNQRYLQAINDGDIDTLSSLTTAEHIMLPPGRPPLIGKDANDAANSRAFTMFDIDETWTPVETEIAGNWAWQRGTFSVTATPRGGGASRTTTGNFLRIYRRQADGSWRMIRDMFNSDNPPAAD